MHKAPYVGRISPESRSSSHCIPSPSFSEERARRTGAVPQAQLTTLGGHPNIVRTEPPSGRTAEALLRSCRQRLEHRSSGIEEEERSLRVHEIGQGTDRCRSPVATFPRKDEVRDSAG